MPDLKACKKCRRLFADYFGRCLCSNCMKEDDELFDRVKKYIQENQNATIFSTSEACDVSEAKIREWLREERLTYKTNEAGLYCETCNEPILSGRYCQKCKSKISREFGAIMRQNEKPAEIKKPEHQGSKMRFLNKA